MSDQKPPEEDPTTRETVTSTDGQPASPDDDGHDVIHRFAEGRTIGEGGMATVVEARDARLDRTVALKRLKPELARHADIRGRFLDEARIQAHLQHPGTVPVFDVGRTPEGDLFYAMERIQGRTLDDLLRSRTDDEICQRSSVLHQVDIFERVCQAIAYAHDQNIIHRDLKPANIMVDRFASVRVMDWGLAKELPSDGRVGSSPRTKAGMVMGTPGYMSPEQATSLSDAVDTETDVFALGVILYEILTGVRPFGGFSRGKVRQEVTSHHPDSPASINPVVGRELSAICMKALEKQPERRYPSARELAEDIRSFRAFEPVSAIRPGLIARVTKWVRRHRVVSASIGTALLIGVLGAAVAGFHYYRDVRLMARGFDTVAEHELRIAGYDREIDALRTRIAEAGDDRAMRRLLRFDLEELEARRAVRIFQKRGWLAAMVGFRVFRPDDRVLERVRTHNLYLANTLMDGGDYHLARAFASDLLDRVAEGNPTEWSSDEVRELRAVVVDAESRLKSRERELEAAVEGGGP